MSGKTWTNYAIAIVVGVVVAVATAGVGLAAYAGTVGVLAFGVTSSLLQARNAQKGGGLNNALAQDLDIASADESNPVPVVFGLQRFAGNYMRYDKDTFSAVAKTETPQGGGKGGGGGGDPVVVGYDYYLSFLYGLCMGPVDGIGAIWDGNNMSRVATGYTAFSADTMTRQVTGADFNGTVTIYRGSDTQTSAPIGGTSKAATWLPYHHTCYVHCENFHLGTQPTPRTLMYEVHRWPKCVDDAGVAIPGLIVSGSNDDTGRCWYDANPAAILFEIFTNGVWGRGLSVDQLDVESFVNASEFYADNDIGLSLVLAEQSTLADIVDFVRRHVNAACIWDGEKLRITVLMNPNDNEVPVKLTRESLNNVNLTRTAWPDTANEVRLEFVDREDAWRPAIAHAQNNAGIAAVGLVNSQLVQLRGFTNRFTAESQCARILLEMGYPQARLTCQSNRFNSRLLPGQRVHLVWEEFTAQATHTFWRVAEFDDSTQSEDGISLVLVEDLYATPYLGAEQAFVPALPGFAGDSYNDSVNESGDSTEPIDPGDLQPIRAFELPIGRTLGAKIFAVLANMGSRANQYAVHQWALASGGAFTTFASTKGWCRVGTLQTAIPTTLQEIQRSTFGITFDLTLLDPDHEADVLGSANKVMLDTDDMQTLLTGYTDLMVIDDEVFAIGKIVETTPGTYRASNFIRALMGTTQAVHSIGAAVYFIPSWSVGLYAISQGDIPTGVDVEFQTNVALPLTGVQATEFPWEGPASGKLLGTGARAFVPGFVSRTIISTTWTVALRPRWHGRGAEANSDWQADLGMTVDAIPDGYSLLVEQFNGGASLGARAPVFSSFDVASSEWRFSLNASASATKLRIWASYKGGVSLDYLDVSA